MTLRVGVLFLLLAAATTPATAGDLHIDGYVKNFLLIQELPEVQLSGGALPFGQAGGNTLAADNLRTRVNLTWDASHWLLAQASYNFIPRVQNDDAALLNELFFGAAAATYRVDDLRPALAPAHPGPDDNLLILQNLDRAYVTITAPRFDLYVGRQAVAWGSARGINPTDVIAPYLFTEIDTEDRIGVDAVRLRIPVGSLQEIDAGWVLAPGGYKTHAFYIRPRGYEFNTDISFLFMTFKQHLLLGVDLARSVMDAGAWLEAAWVADREEFLGTTQSHFTRGDNYWRVSAGLDYSLTNATYLFVEYHLNDAGFADPKDYANAAGMTAYRDGAVYLLGRHYLIPGMAYPATPLVNLGAQLLINMSDGSVLAAPTVEWNVAENFYASAGAFVGLGKQTEVDIGGGVPTDADLTIRSEFGNYIDTFYASIRYYY